MMEQVGVIRTCDCFYQEQFERYNAAASFTARERQFTFKNAVIDDENRLFFEAAVDFVKNVNIHMAEGTWLYLCGDEYRAQQLNDKEGANYSAFGTGKTYLMQCIANALSVRKIPAIFVNEEKLFGDIKATYDRKSDESEQDVLRRYYSVPVLMIDDLFSVKYGDWAEGKLFSILDARITERKITIITSNYAPGRISTRLPLNGGKIASRIMGQAQLLDMIGTDRRLKKRREGTA